jgi:IS5 family transposase
VPRSATLGPRAVKLARVVRERALGILNAKSKEQRTALYRDLLKVTNETMTQASDVVLQLERAPATDGSGVVARLLIEQEIKHVLGLAKRVIDQTERRVLRGESVPASEKIVSIFEPHTDIIVKDRRDTFYGHKICLTSGASGLVLDAVVERGNPADATLAQKMVERAGVVAHRD